MNAKSTRDLPQAPRGKTKEPRRAYKMNEHNYKNSLSTESEASLAFNNLPIKKQN